VFAIQDEISAKIAEKLKVELLGAEKANLAKRQPENLEAYDLCLKGRHFFNKGSGESMKKAIEYYTKAIEIAPDYAQAYAQLTICYIFQGFLNYLPPKDVFPKAKAAALKAIKIDESLAEAHYSLAMIRLLYDWDWDLARKEIELAIELNSNDPECHDHYAVYLCAMGKMAEAIDESDKAIELDPLSTPTLLLRGVYLLRACLLKKALDQFQKTLELEPNFADAHWLLGQALILDSRYDKGITEIKKALDLAHNNFVILAGLGWGYAMSGRKKEALKVLEELNERAKQEYIKPFLFAKIYSALGEKDQAFEWLKKAYDDHDVSLALILTDESIENLRSDPRYAALLKKMGLEDKAK
jgi:serine/threonine-protein kinase